MPIGTASNMEWLVGTSNAQSVVRVDNISSMSTTQTLVHTDDFDIVYNAGNVNKYIYLTSSTVATACVYMQGLTVFLQDASTSQIAKVYGTAYRQAYSGVSLASPLEIWSFYDSTGTDFPMREYTIFYTKDNVPHMTKMTLFCTWTRANNCRVPDYMYASISQQ